MIARDMRLYDYYELGALSAYGDTPLKENPSGSIVMAINVISTNTSDSILYKDSTYIGLTLDKKVNEGLVIQYGDHKLKVNYIIPKGKLIQVFMTSYD